MAGQEIVRSQRLQQQPFAENHLILLKLNILVDVASRTGKHLHKILTSKHNICIDNTSNLTGIYVNLRNRIICLYRGGSKSLIASMIEQMQTALQLQDATLPWTTHPPQVIGVKTQLQPKTIVKRQARKLHESVQIALISGLNSVINLLSN